MSSGKLLHRRGATGLFNPVGQLVHVGSERACLMAFAKIRKETAASDGLDYAYLRVKVKMALWSISPVEVAVVTPGSDLSSLEQGTSARSLILGGPTVSSESKDSDRPSDRPPPET